MAGVEGFWSRLPEYGRQRELDPLGLSAIHEAAADVLLPYVSGRTRRAEDYLWVLVGLRWAGPSSATDFSIWEGFERFEKALKLSWFHEGRRTAGFTGVEAVRDHYDEGRTDLEFKLVSNQRAQGLLGAYLRSLRDARLVETRSLRLSNTGRALIDGIDFSWRGEVSSYGWLANAFRRARDGFSSGVFRDLGRSLFDPEAMRDAAAAIRSLGASPAWQRAAKMLKASTARSQVAAVGDDLARFCKRATGAFWSTLEAPDRKIGRIDTGRLWTGAWRAAVFRSNGMAPLRGPFELFLSAVARRPRPALIQLHETVWDRRGHKVPWIRAVSGKIQVRPDIALKTPPLEAEWDLRWSVVDELVRRTDWKPK